MKELVTFRKYLNEGVINEGVNLDDILDTPQKFNDFVDEIIKDGSLFDKLLNLNFPKIDRVLFDAEQVISNHGLYSEDPDYIEDDWDDVKSRIGSNTTEDPTKRDIIEDLIRFLDTWESIETFEEYEGEFEEKYDIDNDTFWMMYEKYTEDIWANYKKL